MFGFNPLPLLAIPPKNITNHKRSSTISKKNNIQKTQLDKHISPCQNSAGEEPSCLAQKTQGKTDVSKTANLEQFV